MLQDPTKFLESLFKYDNDNIPDAVISKIQPYIDMEDFTPAAISKVKLQKGPKTKQCGTPITTTTALTSQITLYYLVIGT